MKMGFRGTRLGMTEQQRETLRQTLAEYRPDEFHHGDFIGADSEAHRIVRASYPATRIVIHPPTKRTLRAFCDGDEERPALGYLARNRDIIRTCDMLVAAPRAVDEPGKSGTWAVIRFARIRKVTLVMLEP